MNRREFILKRIKRRYMLPIKKEKGKEEELNE